MWFIYGLYNAEASKIYIGQTGNLAKRLEEHNLKQGSHYTAKVSGKWELIYHERVSNRRQALVREKQLKSYRGREFIKQFIPR